MSNEAEVVASALYSVACTLRGDGRPSVILGNFDDWHSQNAEVAIFSYGKDFNHLWGIGKAKGLSDLALALQDRKQPLTMVVVWDEIPSGNTGAVDTTKHLTPLDWAVALSLEIHNAVTLAKDKTNQVYPDLRILILDLNSRFSSDAESVRFFRQFDNLHVKAMPWLHINTPTNDDPEWNTGNIIENMIDPANSQNPVISMKKAFEEEKPDLSILCNIWRALLTRSSTPGDQHAIANLVGPLLLSGEENEYDPNVKALRSLMKALGLIPKGPESGPIEEGILSKDKSWIDWKEEPKWENKLGKGGSLNLLLIDDQYPQGWGKVLSQAVGASYDKKDFIASQVMEAIGKHTTESGKNIFVKASASANWLLDKLKDGKDQRFSFSIDPANAEEEDKVPEILFLDLRLFSGKNLKDEAIFIKALCGIAEKFVDNNDSKDKKNRPWPGFSSTEIDQVRQWCDSDKKNQDGEDSEYIDALTFLPRILSLTDLSLPIVLFSSTGRRHISEKLKGYDNIITDFDKPKFTVDMPDDIAEQTKRKFQEALEKALRIIEGRKMLNRLTGGEKKKIFSEGEQIPGHVHVELYIDEHHPKSGNNEKRNNIWVGGCYVMFVGSDKDEAIAAAYAFDDSLVENGYYYFSRGSYLPKFLTNKSVKAKHDNALAELKAALISGKKPYKIEPVRLRCNMTVSKQEDETGDHSYREALTLLVEILICELLPQLKSEVPKIGVSFSVYAGTRVAEHLDQGLARSLSYKYGLFLRQDRNDSSKYLLESLSPSTLFPVIDDIRRFREAHIEIEQAIGIRMIYDIGYGNKPSFSPEGRLFCRKCKIAFDTKLLTRAEVLQWGSEPSCPLCKEKSNVRPQYPGGLYIADQIMNQDFEKGPYSKLIKTTNWGFDENINKNLTSLVKAGRSVDVKNRVRAAWLAASTISEETSKTATLHSSILARIAPELQAMTGREFYELAKALGDNIEPSDHAVVRGAEPNNSGRAKAHSTSRSNNRPNNNAPRATLPTKPMQGGLAQKAINTPAAQKSPVSINVEKESITVTRTEGVTGGTRFICAGKGGREIIISPNEAKKTRSANPDITMNVGSALKVRIAFENNKFFARDIELITSNEAQDISFVQAEARTNAQEPKKAGEQIQGGLEQKAINTPAVQNSSVPINIQKEFITVTRSEVRGNRTIFICKGEGGREIIIRPDEAKKTRSANPDIAINIGSVLKARIDIEDNKLIAKDIELMISNEAQDISLVQAGARTNEQEPKHAGEPTGKELLTVQSIPHLGRPRLICKREDGGLVEVSKSGLELVKIGDTLRGDISSKDGNLYAKDIEFVTS